MEETGYSEVRRQRKRRECALFIVLLFLVVLLFALNLGIGSVSIPPKRIFSLLFQNTGDPAEKSILMTIRLPRACLAAVLGGALSLSGFLLQTYFENPLAGPYVLGISSGAKLTVAIVMIFFLERFSRVSSAVLVLAAFFGAMLTTGCILLVARRIDHIASLLVAGIMIGYICSAISEFAITFAEENDIVNLHGWSQGSFSGATMTEVLTATCITAIAFLAAFLLAKPIAALRLGEAYAKSAGVKIRRVRLYLILLSSVLSATVTAFAGPVSFVGIAVPVLIKRIFRSSEPRTILPTCFLGGAVFCLFCDLLARTLFLPTELTISTVTAVFGAPVVIVLLIKRQKG